MLAPDRGLATVPITDLCARHVDGHAAASAGSRAATAARASFFVGTGFGVLTGLICLRRGADGVVLAVLLGAFFSGLYAAAHQSYRFAAADTASDAFRPKAISWVMVGGIFAGIVGPQLVIGTKDLLAAVSVRRHLSRASRRWRSLSARGADVRRRSRCRRRSTRGEPGRPLSEIARQPRFIVAVACGVASYSMMNMVMTSAPLAMVECNHSVGDATLGIQWHVLGMFVPSLFTGSLILRFGVERIDRRSGSA